MCLFTSTRLSSVPSMFYAQHTGWIYVTFYLYHDRIPPEYNLFLQEQLQHHFSKVIKNNNLKSKSLTPCQYNYNCNYKNEIFNYNYFFFDSLGLSMNVPPSLQK